ncbi:dihydroxyacetone kinase Dak1 [Xanthoria parietina]
MASAKHFFDDPTTAVLSALRGVTLLNPSLLFDEKNKIIYRHPSSIASPKNVSVICGGGSGHEPGFSAFVGQGALTACVAGTIFASPSAQQVRACLSQRLPAETEGVVVVVTNYTGDVLNFGMGIEKARAMGKKVEMVVVADDVGVGRAKGGKVGRRGLSGTALVVKICGALAEAGASVRDCAKVGRLVVDNLVSVGASLSRVHVPGRSLQEAQDEVERLGPGLVEIGMGIHNEPGCEKVKTDLPGLVKIMLAQLLDPNDKDRAYVKIEKGADTVLLINNFGGTSNLELSGVVTEIVSQLDRDYGLHPRRVFFGTFFGSLNGPGFIISVLKLAVTGLGSGKSILELLDAPAEATGWAASVKPETWEKRYGQVDATDEEEKNDTRTSNLKVDPSALKSSLKSGLNKLISCEAEVTRYDSIVGDGDCGVGLKRGAEGINQYLEEVDIPTDALLSLTKIASIVEATMDGTSGALYAIFLNALAANIRKQDSTNTTDLTPLMWAHALSESLKDLGVYTPAQPGDRTLMDALVPFVETLKSTGSTKQAAEAAKRGAESTKGMKPSLGRSVYVGGKGHDEVPDPGAYGLSQFLTGLAEAL